MKFRALLLSGLFCVWSFHAAAQSTFILQNYHPGNLSLLNAPVSDAEGNRLAGANYAAELWGGASTDSLFPTVDYISGQRVFASFLTGIGAGYFNANATMTVNQVGGGQFAWVQV